MAGGGIRSSVAADSRVEVERGVGSMAAAVGYFQVQKKGISKHHPKGHEASDWGNVLSILLTRIRVIPLVLIVIVITRHIGLNFKKK